MTSLFLFDSFCFSDPANDPAAEQQTDIGNDESLSRNTEEEFQSTVESSTPEMIKALKDRLEQVIQAKSNAENALLDASIENDYMRTQIANLEAKVYIGEVWTNISSRDISRRDSIDSHESLRIRSPRTIDSSPRTMTQIPVVRSSNTLDTKDLENIHKVNKFLKKLADDVVFQEKLTKPTVQWAFVYWSGGDVSKIEHKADEIKQCEVVRSIYPGTLSYIVVYLLITLLYLNNHPPHILPTSPLTPLSHTHTHTSYLDLLTPSLTP